ncbi:hypothetical protein AWJ15_14475 [Lacticaseibacillus rhamnosus]|nr:hypothetical protein AWJ15_14475 [Lacticaseibacillus rhamnosus]
MKYGPYRFMSWIGFTLSLTSSFLPAKYMNFGAYKTFTGLTLLAVLFALWDISDAIREGKHE